MKILTLNAHSLLEDNYLRKLAWFVELVLREEPDLIALQEVNQSISAPFADEDMFEGMIPQKETYVPLRSDNHAAWIAYLLRRAGMPSSWAWLPVKIGYDRYDEGIALMSFRDSIAKVDILNLSRCCDYRNWRTRKALGVQLKDARDWFYTVHMGWWNDETDPFCRQWHILNESAGKHRAAAPVWLLGDFNAPAEVRGEGYDQIRNDGWNDAWLMAGRTRGCATVAGKIDGWENGCDGMRIDHIWCSRAMPIRSARVVFDGTHEPRISDHFGILLETC